MKKRTNPKTVQIPIETFSDLVAYFYYGDHSERLYDAIRQAVEDKVDRMVERDIYMDKHGFTNH